MMHDTLQKVTTLLVFTLALVSFSACSTSASAEESLLPVGLKAPHFSLKDQSGKQHVLANYVGKNLIVVFYPMDNTPGCSAQLCALRDVYLQLKKLNTEVLGSNPADAQSHLSFVKKQKYPFALLVDDKKKMAKDYHVDGAVGFNRRTVYVIDAKSKIRFAERGTPTIETLMTVLNRLNKETL